MFSGPLCNVSDISIAVVDLLQEMTDVDTLTENDEGADVLIDSLVCLCMMEKFRGNQFHIPGSLCRVAISHIIKS